MSLLVVLLLLAGNAFFVGAEFAIITARRDRLESIGGTRARTVIRAGRELPLLIAGAQLGITLCSLGLGALGEPAVAGLLEAPFAPFAIPDAVRHGVAFALALVIVVALHTVLGEMVPKNLAIAGPEQVALWLVPAHYWFCRMVAPVLNGFTVVATAILRLLGVTPKEELESAYTRDELALLIAQSRQEGLLEDSEHRRLAQTLSSATRTVADVLVPLDRVTSVSANPTMGEVEEAVAATGFSRFPVRDEGRLTGYLHVKDVLDLADAEPGTTVPRGRIRGLPEVPVDARLDEAVAALRRSQSHLARAVAADGELRGVVALEDLVEEYVGTVRDGTHVRREA
ncbi:hemolysin family protein [Actinosynnema sp. NPDC020468]|uniref:hemolysin family protein n=1 Tax=Actinosynnema sp. NPDC020468 TaxID=3154488 RepID=UPI003406E5A2